MIQIQIIWVKSILKNAQEFSSLVLLLEVKEFIIVSYLFNII